MLHTENFSEGRKMKTGSHIVHFRICDLHGGSIFEPNWKARKFEIAGFESQLLVCWKLNQIRT